MLTLDRARRVRGSAGECLPPVFPALEAMNFRFRRGQMVLIASAPGRGKTAVALTLALLAKVPTLYFTPDTDGVTLAHRAAAALTNTTITNVEAAYENDMGEFFDEKLILSSTHLRIVEDEGLSSNDIDEEMMAFAATYGEWPHLVVVDSLYNVYAGEGDGITSGLERAQDYLHQMGRISGAAVVVLHHVTGQYDSGLEPVPLDGLRGKVSKIPERVITLYSPQEPPDEFGAVKLQGCIVKNRNGKNDPGCGLQVTFRFDQEKMRFA